MIPAPPAGRLTSSDEAPKMSALNATTSSPAVSRKQLIPKHWEFINLGNGVHGATPETALLFEDELVLGERIAYAFDDEAIWGADGIILFMGAPGAPWEGQ